MATGDVAEVRLKGSEAIENVPRSVREHGHTILSLDVEDSKSSADGVHRLVLSQRGCLIPVMLSGGSGRFKAQ